MTPIPVISLPGNSTPVPEPKVLGPNQLQWLRENVEHFATCEKQVLQAEEHRKKMLEGVRQ